MRLIYDRLLDHFGPRGWWPAETDWEVVVGAILTQNVAWRNVVQAIDNLRGAGLLELERMRQASEEELAVLIVPTRFYQVKARKLKRFVSYLVENYDGDLYRLLDQPWAKLRGELLSLWGLGPETVDSILLYAGRHPVFVVDAYTRRIFSRLRLLPEDAGYQEMQDFFMLHLRGSEEIYNEYHALIDGLGNRVCLSKKPRCGECPLREMCGEDRNGAGT
ncbi:MAG: endonuclease III domain-containing protein [Firmicutes bacterium]|nr:endonuclease III domain-containing protein [Bacillota bacterium]